MNGTKVTKLFELYAYHHLTLDSLQEASLPRGHLVQRFRTSFPRSKLYAILRDRSYIGEVELPGAMASWHTQGIG